MIATAVLALALQQPAGPPPITPVPEEAARIFTRILQRTPVFAPGMKRTIVAPLNGVTAPQAPFPVYVVEVPWTSASGSGTAVALFIDIPGFAVANRMPVTEVEKQLKGAEGAWGLGELTENKTLSAWLDDQNARRRQLNEASALSDLRTMGSAQAVLQTGGGHYAEPECLPDPKACFGTWDGEPPGVFALTGEKGGYRRTFHPGLRPQATKTSMPKLLRTWAMTATPLSTETGRRAFCIDNTGLVCATGDGTMGPVVDGACPKTCTPVP